MRKWFHRDEPTPLPNGSNGHHESYEDRERRVREVREEARRVERLVRTLVPPATSNPFADLFDAGNEPR
jgi:hypothetical protein